MSPGGRWRFESEFQPGDGAVSADPQASGGRARSAPSDFSGVVVGGPFLFLEPGRYRVEFHIKADAGGTTGVLGEVQINSECGKRIHARRSLPASEFAGGDGYRKVSVVLETDTDLSDCEFRVLAHGKGALYVDQVELVCER
jgi:hypothetical protein